MRIIKIVNCVGNVILLLLLSLLLMIKIPSLAGYQVFYILSESMAPVMNPGALIYVKESDVSEVVPGECITFRLGTDTELTATHRVVAVDLKTLEITTQGDANPGEDIMKVTEDNLIGKVAVHIPYLGYGMYFLQTGIGKVCCVMIFIFALINKKSPKD